MPWGWRTIRDMKGHNARDLSASAKVLLHDKCAFSMGF